MGEYRSPRQVKAVVTVAAQVVATCVQLAVDAFAHELTEQGVPVEDAYEVRMIDRPSCHFLTFYYPTLQSLSYPDLSPDLPLSIEPRST